MHALGAALVAVLCGTVFGLTCHELIIPVDISAANKALPPKLTGADVNPDYIFETVPGLPNRTVSGRFHVGARYCEPSTHIHGREHTLQLLVHGATYTRDYWSGLAPPGTNSGQDRYSWVKYAADRGYATLSVDRLCNGQSSHPDGVVACQYPLEGEALRAIVGMARAGKLPCTSKCFERVVAVGHSAGSLVLNRLTQDHPELFNAQVLSGFSFNISNGFASFANLNIGTAAQLRPEAFRDLPDSYLTSGSESGSQEDYYYGSFDPALVRYDYAHRDTVTVGQNAGIALGQQPVPKYRGPLFIVNGEQDRIFCSLEPIVHPKARCSSGFTKQVRKYYPAASRFGFHNTPNTGHCLNLHYTARESFAAAHRFLQQAGF